MTYIGGFRKATFRQSDIQILREIRLIFSQYIVLEKVPGSVDPLGFLRPSSALADKLFRQFTVLSNHPAYHGFLCCAYDYLRRAGVAPGRRDFSRRFRDLEILWGLINVWDVPPEPAGSDGKNGRQGETATAAVSILNVTKFKPLLKESDLSLSDIRSNRPPYDLLYQRLNYGTLGHYSSPSIFWGLLDAKGVNLTPLGQRLAGAWRQRGNLDFDDLLRQWEVAGKPAAEISGFDSAVRLFPIGAQPSAGEKAVWLDLIGDYCRRHPDTRCLWESPLSSGDLDLYVGGNGADDVERGRQRANFFPTAIEHWQGEPELTNRLRLADGFEIQAALAQAIFEWEYVRRLDEVSPNLPDAGIPEALFELAKHNAETYLALPGAAQPGALFESMATAKSAGQLAATVREHHASHQKSKGAMAYIVDEHVAVRDKVDVNDFGRFVAAVAANPSELTHRLRWRYRRDWHFLRAETWRSYANGVRP